MVKQFAALSLLLILGGCGSGGEDSPLPLPGDPVCRVNVEWEAPTEYTGGAPMTFEDISKFFIFVSYTQDLDAQEFSIIVEVDDPALTMYSLSELPRGLWWFAMKVEDIHGETSAYSNVQEFNCIGSST